MANPKDPQALANRLRTAAESLTDPRDVSVAQQYIHELETIAAEQDAEAFESVSGSPQRPPKQARLRSARRSAATTS